MGSPDEFQSVVLDHLFPTDAVTSAAKGGAPPNTNDNADEDEIFGIMGKKRKRTEKSPAEIAMKVEEILATLEVAAEEDAQLNRESKPVVNKLKNLPLLNQILLKKQLQPAFLDHGVLAVLKTWLEPLPDGSLPNVCIRTAVLTLLADFPMGPGRREQLKTSGLGKVVMFLSKSDEETVANKRAAKRLTYQWCRQMCDTERPVYSIPQSSKMPAPKVAARTIEFRDVDLDFPRGRSTVRPSESQRVSRPEANTVHFVVHPPSKIDPDEVRERARQAALKDQRRMNMNKKLQRMKGSRKKPLQAIKVSAQGRGLAW